jgi:hypothetical protein
MVARFADLDTPFFLPGNPFVGGDAIKGGRISLGPFTVSQPGIRAFEMPLQRFDQLR